MGFRKSFPSRRDGMTWTAEGLGQGVAFSRLRGGQCTGTSFPLPFSSVPLCKVTGWDQI